AIRDGLSLVWWLGIRRIEVETDSQAAILLIRGNAPSTHPDWVLIDDCRSLLTNNWEATISFVPRGANSVADCLAKLGHQLGHSEECWDTAPPSVELYLRQDKMGVGHIGNPNTT
ncbi:unnamed protein product, partial [Linum tenue]